MKFLIIAVYVFVVVNGQLDKFRENVAKVLEECKEMVGGSDAEVEDIIHNITPDSDTGKCLLACANKKFKVQNSDGKLNHDLPKEAAIEGLDEKVHTLLTDIKEKCIHEVHDQANECETAAHWFTCFSKGQADAGIPPILMEA